MIKDYSVYEMSVREKAIFCFFGYVAIAAAVHLFYNSIFLSLLSGLSVVKLVPYGEKKLADRRMNVLNGQFKDMLYALSSSVASGRQMVEALIEAEEELSAMYGKDELIMKELRHMRISMMQNKESDKTLLKDFAARSKSEDINDFVNVYVICRSMGGDLERIITHTTEILTDKMAIDREIRALTAQKKVEGRIISLMPFLMLLMMNLFSYSYVEPLYTTAAGRILMTAALAATVWGIYLMEKISDVQI